MQKNLKEMITNPYIERCISMLMSIETIIEFTIKDV